MAVVQMQSAPRYDLSPIQVLLQGINTYNDWKTAQVNRNMRLLDVTGDPKFLKAAIESQGHTADQALQDEIMLQEQAYKLNKGVEEQKTLLEKVLPGSIEQLEKNATASMAARQSNDILQEAENLRKQALGEQYGINQMMQEQPVPSQGYPEGPHKRLEQSILDRPKGKLEKFLDINAAVEEVAKRPKYSTPAGQKPSKEYVEREKQIREEAYRPVVAKRDELVKAEQEYTKRINDVAKTVERRPELIASMSQGMRETMIQNYAEAQGLYSGDYQRVTRAIDRTNKIIDIANERLGGHNKITRYEVSDYLRLADGTRGRTGGPKNFQFTNGIQRVLTTEEQAREMQRDWQDIVGTDAIALQQTGQSVTPGSLNESAKWDKERKLEIEARMQQNPSILAADIARFNQKYKLKNGYIIPVDKWYPGGGSRLSLVTEEKFSKWLKEGYKNKDKYAVRTAERLGITGMLDKMIASKKKEEGGKDNVTKSNTSSFSKNLKAAAQNLKR